jgi:hypothetical protein
VNKASKKKMKPKIRGLIIPEKWDDNGGVLRVALHTDDEKAYVVEHSRKGKELVNFIHKKVQATGKIRERLDGKILITVQDYVLVEEQFENDIARA